VTIINFKKKEDNWAQKKKHRLRSDPDEGEKALVLYFLKLFSEKKKKKRPYAGFLKKNSKVITQGRGVSLSGMRKKKNHLRDSYEGESQEKEKKKNAPEREKKTF